jgi:predicted nucleic acid-binding protein
MAGHARYTAILDACVLFPAPIADASMSLHAAGLFAAQWSGRIDEEWIRGVLRARPELDGKLQRRRDAMRRAVPDREVPPLAYEPLTAGLGLPDKDDVHVLAAAIAGHADCIVTLNLKDFPADLLGKHGLEAIHPDDFLVYQSDLEPITALAAFKAMRDRLRNPQLTVDEFTAMLQRNGLVNTALRLQEARALV